MKTRLGMLLLFSLCAAAQEAPTAPAPAALESHFRPGDVLKYEFEGRFSLTPQRDSEYYRFRPALQGCDYGISARIQVRFSTEPQEGVLAGSIHYQDIRLNAWACKESVRKELEGRLRRLQAAALPFRINQHGEVRIADPEDETFDHSSGLRMLEKAAVDILQVKVSDRPVSPGATWNPGRRFVYWKDRFEDGLSVAAASMSYQEDVTVAGDTCARLRLRRVFSPEDLPAYLNRSAAQAGYEGTTFVAGTEHLELLFDREQRRMAFVRRTRRLENRLVLRDPELALLGPVPLLTYRIEEDAQVRWIREENPERWLAGLEAFEHSLKRPARAAESTTVGGPALGDVARAMREEKKERTSPAVPALRIEQEALDRPPAGFRRWEQPYCGEEGCFSVSVALPESAVVSEQGRHGSIFLAQAGGATIYFSIGPPLERRFYGQPDSVALSWQAANYLESELWLASGPGQATASQDTSLDGRPALVTDFLAPRRDFVQMQGRLALVLLPWNKVIPVACGYKQTEHDKLAATCATVVASLRIR